MSTINNLDIYTRRMSKGIEDKISFYENLLDNENMYFFIDFGCGDGSLIKYLAQKYPLIRFIGYDNSLEMIKLAKENTKHNYNVFLYSDFETLIQKLSNVKGSHSILNFSSVMHEVLSYSTVEELRIFWENIRLLVNNYVKYITFRDMCVDESYQNIDTPWNIYAGIRSHASECQVEDFEVTWGSLNSYRNAIHFLLKYRYVENWDRENNENYLAIPSATAIQDAFLNCILWPAEVIYSEHYTLPYTKDSIKEDFNFYLNVPTHLKFIIEVK